MGILQNYTEGDHTRLNKLKYGDVQSLSREPIVKKTIPTTVGDTGPKANQITKRIDDLQRIATLFTQPGGLKYIANETALNSIVTEPKQPGLKGKLEVLGNNLLGTLRTIGSTLAQVPLNGTGTHFVKGFQGVGKGTYLHKIGLKPLLAPHSTVRGGGIVNVDPKVIRDSKKSSFADRTQTTLNPQPVGKDIGWDTQFSDYPAIEPVNFAFGVINSLNPNSVYEKNYGLSKNEKDNLKKENRIGLGDAASKTLKRGAVYNIADVSTQDKINMLAPTSEKPNGLTGDTGRDLIKFYFNVITPEEPSKYLYFRAYLDSFNDNFAGNWNSFNYVGRGEQFHTYSGFSRTISLSFKIAAQSRQEMRPLYQKIVYLASSTAPSYSKGGYMRGTFTELTVGDYVSKLPGFITSLQYSWDQDYPWEIALNSPELLIADKDQQELPMVLNCSISFTPIHNFVPETGLKHYITANREEEGKSFFKNGKAIENSNNYLAENK